MRRAIKWLDEATRRPGALKVVLWAAVVLGLALLVLLFWKIGSVASVADRNSNQLERAAAVARARASALSTANDRLYSAGEPTVNPTKPKPTEGDTKVGKVPSVTGPPGPAGKQGATGRGITGTAIEGGHLWVRYSDGAEQDLGRITGRQGPQGKKGDPGKDGADGVSITSTSVSDSGVLTVTYSDGTSTEAGVVVGPRGPEGSAGPTGPKGDTGSQGDRGPSGRGIKSVTVSSEGRLIVTYTDGTADDLGPLPKGPKGDQGKTGPSGPTGPSGKPGKNAPTISGLACSGDVGLTLTVTMSDGTIYTVTCSGGGGSTSPTSPPPSSTPPPSTE